MKFALVWTVLLSLIDWGLSARILAVMPFPGKSHYVFISAVLNSLARRGHQVVVYSPFPPSKPIPNFTHVPLHTSLEKIVQNWTYDNFLRIAGGKESIVGFRHIWELTYSVCEDTFKHESIQKLLNSSEHFDLVMTESTFGQESMVAFGDRFGAPTVTLQGFYTWSALNRDAGNALSIASIPHFNGFTATDQMTFSERVYNLIVTSLTLFSYYFHHLPIHENIMRQYYCKDAPPLVDMVSNISLYLICAHPGIEYTHPYTPNIIPIAGITISPERIPLPQDIQKFMDEAKEGVIYFSLGTVVPAHLFPKEILQIYVNVFKKLPQRVLWKIDIENIFGLSENVKLSKWLPQPGVLSHPNCVLFLTHGGLFGQQEAIHAGVPTVAIPFFGDQPFNVRYNEHRGIGVKLDFKTISEDTVMLALNTVLKNPMYRANVQRLSRIYRDRPLSPSDTAVFWVEYVLRHRGAHHLRPAAAQLPWYQLFLLDILAAILAVLFTVFITLYLVAKKIMSLLCGRNEKSKLTKEKKNN